MIERYSTPEMSKIWTDENKFMKMLEVEIAVCEALVKYKKMSHSVFLKLKKRAKFDVKKIRELEKVTKHDVIAFLTEVSRNVGAPATYLHRGLTSSDALDSALALQMRESLEILISDLKILSSEIKRKAQKYKNTVMVGRTHGIHAEPITFGFKLLGWYVEVLRHIEMLKKTRQHISFGKISGAVGTYAHISPEIEAYTCKLLKLTPETVSTQIIPRDRHAFLLCNLALVASSIEKFATEIRTLQRTEISEVEEPFSEGQKGSSAMPHKRNPVLCEQLCGLSRIIRSNAVVSLENVTLWNERDISHSSTERIILPDSMTLLDYALKKMTHIIKNMKVKSENMKRNLKTTEYMIFSQRLLLEIVSKGYSREKIYPLVQKLSQDGFSDIGPLKKYLRDEEIKKCFDVKYYLRHLNYIYGQIK